jgi:hypothetical protein
LNIGHVTFGYRHLRETAPGSHVPQKGDRNRDGYGKRLEPEVAADNEAVTELVCEEAMRRVRIAALPDSVDSRHQITKSE